MPSQAQSDQTQVRFLHAVAGAGPASLLVEKGSPQLPSAFAKPSGYQVFRPGQTRLRLILNGQSSPIASEIVRLGPGKHTVVAVGGDNGVDLLVYQDDGVEPGKATLRAVHVASEVGKADVRVDGKVVATGVGLGDDTGYLALPPGRHSVAVTRPGGEGGPLVKAQVRAVTGTAASGFVVGSAGMPAQIVLTEDGSAGPVTAPATGLGGATSDGAWLLIFGSALIGGSLGGASFVLARRMRSRGALQVSTPAGSAGPPTPSSVAAGPPVAAEKDEQEEATQEAPAAPVVIAAATPPPLPPLPSLPALPPMRTAPVTPAPLEIAAAAPAAVDASGNGFHADNGTNGSDPEASANGHHGESDDAPPAPALWAPPPGERWTAGPAKAPTGRFARKDPEAGPAVPAPPSSPRFIRPDPEPATEAVPSAEAEPAADANSPELDKGPYKPLVFTFPPVADAPAPETERPLSPWPEGPAPKPYPPVPSATPEPAKAEPVAPEIDEPWTGSWIAEPVTAPEPPATFVPAPEPEPVQETVAEPVAETVVEPDEVVEPPAPDHSAEETIVDAVEVVEEAPEMEQPTDPAPEPETTGVRTWSSSTSSRPATATVADRPHKVNFLVVSGAALVVTGLIAARRGGRH